MIDDDIRKLIEQDSAADLGSLEADVWRREEALRAGRRTTRRVAAWQGLVLAVAVVGSATTGFALTVKSPEMHTSSLLMPGQNLAPSSLLFGPHR